MTDEFELEQEKRKAELLVQLDKIDTLASTHMAPYETLADDMIPKLTSLLRGLLEVYHESAMKRRMLQIENDELYAALKLLMRHGADPGRGSGFHRVDYFKAMDVAREALALVEDQ